MTSVPTYSRRTFGALLMSSVAACGPRVPASNVVSDVPQQVSFLPEYEPIFDAGYNLPGIPSDLTTGVNRRMSGLYLGEQGPGTLDVDPYAKFLYYIEESGRAIRIF